MDIEATQPSLNDLATVIGQVQIYWCFLESEMKRQLAAVGKPPSKKQSVVFNWRKMVVSTTGDAENCAETVGTLDRISRGRNLLAHGIASTSANPWTQNSAFVDCIDFDGKTHRLTIDELQSLLQDIDRFRLLIRARARLV
jgi:hypothetical protein